MQHLKIKKVQFFEILFCLLGCGIFGWIYETVFVFIQDGTLTDRGILFVSYIGEFPIIWGLPFILIYGVGGAILIWAFKPLKKNPILLFIVGLVSMTAFEYLTAVISEAILGMKLWDYSDKFMNFQGRICLFTSFMWGLLTLLAVYVFGPVFHKLYAKLEKKSSAHVGIIHVLLVVLVIYIIVCYLLRPVLFPTMV